MDEIEYKLKKKNAIIVGSAVAKLVDIVQGKKSSGAENINEVAELKLLKEICQDPDPLVSITSCQGLVMLVEDGILEVPPTFAGLVSALPSARNYTGIISAIGTLLLIDLKTQVQRKGSYKCPFNLHTLRHPLITVLKQKKDVWIDVFNQVTYFCYHQEKIVKDNAVELLRPFILYVLCDPAQPSQLPENCKRQLWSVVLRLPVHIDVQQSPESGLLFETLSWLQVDCESGIREASFVYIELADIAVGHNNLNLATAIAPIISSLALQLVCKGYDPRYSLRCLLNILQQSSQCGNIIIMILSEASQKCPAVYLKDFVVVCNTIVAKGACSVMAAKMLESVLLQWFAYPSYLTQEALEVASDALNCIHNTRNWSLQTETLHRNEYFRFFKATDSNVDFVFELARLAESWQSDSKNISLWLDRLSHCPQHFIARLSILISALFLHSFDQSEVRQKSMQLLLNLVKHDNEYGTAVVTLFLYKLADERDPHSQMELLRGLPLMAAQKENVALVIHTLESLKSTNSMKSLVLSLFVEVWKTEPRCYPYLQRLLLEGEGDWEFEIARAAAIKEICETRAHQHSSEMTPLLSQILNRLGGPTGSVASLYALQGIAELCKSGSLDACSAWKALAPKLSRDKRPAVVIGLCQFFGLIPQLRPSGHEYEKLVNEVAVRLWSYVSTSTNIDIIKAALRALSQFKLEAFTLKSLPLQYRQGLQLPSSYAKTPVEAARKPEDVLPYIPGECWVQFLMNVNAEALKEAGDFVSHLITLEVEEYGRGIYHITNVGGVKGEPATYGYLHAKSVCHGLVDYLYKLAQKNVEIRNEEMCQTVCECLRILSQTYPKLLAPLNWSFLLEFMKQGPHFTKHCLTIAAKQALTSGSARQLLENFLTTYEKNIKTDEDIIMVYTNLGDLCKGVPPNVLKPFIDETLTKALVTASTSEDQNPDAAELFKKLMSCIKAAFQKEDIHDANRMMLAVAVEGLLENINPDDKLFDIYVSCVEELPTKNLERMSSPSVWWEVTPDKLQKAIKIRSALAQRVDSEVPLVWLNEIIDAVMNLNSEHSYVLKAIAPILANSRERETNCHWILELMGQIQSVLRNEKAEQQGLIFLCDVFMLVIIIMSAYDCLTMDLERISIVQETRLLLFPGALKALFSLTQWKSICPQVVEWLHHLHLCTRLPPQYTSAFYKGLIGLHHVDYFKKPSVWMRILAVKPVNNH